MTPPEPLSLARRRRALWSMVIVLWAFPGCGQSSTSPLGTLSPGPGSPPDAGGQGGASQGGAPSSGGAAGMGTGGGPPGGEGQGGAPSSGGAAGVGTAGGTPGSGGVGGQDGGSPDAAEAGAGGCPGSGSWTALSTPLLPHLACVNFLALWTGQAVFYFGGVYFQGLGDFAPPHKNYYSGGLFDPVQGTNSLVTSPPDSVGQVPDWGDRAVWTGTEVLIWGGSRERMLAAQDSVVRAYDVTLQQWTGASSPGAPSPRSGHVMAWTGSSLLVWGGQATEPNAPAQGDGALYNPVTQAWKPMSSLNAPAARTHALSAWTGSRWLIWGGDNALPIDPDGGGLDSRTFLADGAQYDPMTDTWFPLSSHHAPRGSEGAVSVWTDTRWLVWGGYENLPQGVSNLLGEGAAYDPVSDTWTPMASLGAPSPRTEAAAAWTGKQMFLWGGGDPLGSVGPDPSLFSGGLYDPQLDVWQAVTPCGAPSNVQGLRAVWTGAEVVVFGGQDVLHLPLAATFVPP